MNVDNNLHNPLIATDPLHEQAGLAYGKAVTCITAQVNKSQKIVHFEVIICVSTLISSVVGVATLISVAVLCSIFIAPAAPVGIALAGTGLALLSVFVSGLIAFGITWLIGKEISNLMLRSAQKTCQCFANKHQNAFMNTREVLEALKLCKEAEQNSMISDMNFEQLMLAKNIMGEDKFKYAIQHVWKKKKSHHLWKMVLELTSAPGHPNENMIQSEEFQTLIKDSLLFTRAVHQQLKGVTDKKIRELITPPLKFPPLDVSNSKKITLKVKTLFEIEIEKEFLIQRSGFFNSSNDIISEENESQVFDCSTLIDTFNIECEKPKTTFREFSNFIEEKIRGPRIDPIPKTNYNDFLTYIGAITHDKFVMTKENAVKLIPFADAFLSTTLLNYIDAYISNNIDFFDGKEIEAILEKYSDQLPLLAGQAQVRLGCEHF